MTRASIVSTGNRFCIDGKGEQNDEIEIWEISDFVCHGGSGRRG
jgi:hypothetical protein